MARKCLSHLKKKTRSFHGSVHDFDDTEVKMLRVCMLDWYDKHRRHLPWRQVTEAVDVNQRAYAVWVSEIMLQQTQVATVIDYYTRWMQKWPSLDALAKATLEEVNEMWSGLGYYSRGRRLLEGATKVMDEMEGQMPDSVEKLMASLPGVGRYTAAAIASIAFQKVTGLVDGNVNRVIARMRVISADISRPPVTAALWSAVDTLVDPKRPGDFNQSLMELGATVCMPRTPQCDQCPVSHLCHAYSQVQKTKETSALKFGQNVHASMLPPAECDIEDCCLCTDDKLDSSLGVLNYPRKGKKKPPREETAAVCVVHRTKDGERQFLLVQRPATGLLAGLWEFPSVAMETGSTDRQCWKAVEAYLRENLGVGVSPQGVGVSPQGLGVSPQEGIQHIGHVSHVFSHIRQTYVVDSALVKLEVDTGSGAMDRKWVDSADFHTAAVSTAMRKVLKAFEDKTVGMKKLTRKVETTKRKKAMDHVTPSKKQPCLESFFKTST